MRPRVPDFLSEIQLWTTPPARGYGKRVRAWNMFERLPQGTPHPRMYRPILRESRFSDRIRSCWCSGAVIPRGSRPHDVLLNVWRGMIGSPEDPNRRKKGYTR